VHTSVCVYVCVCVCVFVYAVCVCDFFSGRKGGGGDGGPIAFDVINVASFCWAQLMYLV
jgi:hypothetical protein